MSDCRGRRDRKGMMPVMNLESQSVAGAAFCGPVLMGVGVECWGMAFGKVVKGVGEFMCVGLIQPAVRKRTGGASLMQSFFRLHIHLYLSEVCGKKE